MAAVEAVPADVVARAELLEAFRRREPSVVRALYREYGRLVYAVADRVLRRDDLAQDAVQQTFVQAWRAADRIDVDRDPTSWLMTIAKHAAIDMLRYETRRAARSLTDAVANDAAVATSSIPDIETLDTVWRVRRAIDELPPDEATVVRLQHVDGLTQVEIADAVGHRVGNGQVAISPRPRPSRGAVAPPARRLINRRISPAVAVGRGRAGPVRRLR